VIAYHQPVTRAEIEEVRGVALSKGTLDTLLEIGWVRPKGRRRTPGRPVTWVTSDVFLDHFGLESVEALPGVEELRAAGLLDVRSAISTLGAQALSDTARTSIQDSNDGEVAEEEPGEQPEDALDEAAVVAALGDLPEEE
jgi:segregation and condensation protein B